MEENKRVSMETSDSLRDLRIVRQTIDRVRRDVGRYTSRVMLVWGVLVFATSLVVGHMWQHTGSPAWNLLWVFMAVVGVAGGMVMSRGRRKLPQTFVGRVVGCVWLAFAWSCLVVCVVSMVSARLGAGRLPITPVIILCMAFAGVVSGYVAGSRLSMWCSAAVAVVCPLLAHCLAGPYEMVVMALASALTLVVPGLLTYVGERKKGV